MKKKIKLFKGLREKKVLYITGDAIPNFISLLCNISTVV